MEELLEYGAITEEEARVHPQKNIITRAVGSEAQVEADYYRFSLKSGDILLLCSDGLSNTLTDQEMLSFAEDYPDPGRACHTPGRLNSRFYGFRRGIEHLPENRRISCEIACFVV